MPNPQEREKRKNSSEAARAVLRVFEFPFQDQKGFDSIDILNGTTYVTEQEKSDFFAQLFKRAYYDTDFFFLEKEAFSAIQHFYINFGDTGIIAWLRYKTIQENQLAYSYLLHKARSIIATFRQSGSTELETLKKYSNYDKSGNISDVLKKIALLASEFDLVLPSVTNELEETNAIDEIQLEAGIAFLLCFPNKYEDLGPNYKSNAIFNLLRYIPNQALIDKYASEYQEYLSTPLDELKKMTTSGKKLRFAEAKLGQYDREKYILQGHKNSSFELKDEVGELVAEVDKVLATIQEDAQKEEINNGDKKRSQRKIYIKYESNKLDRAIQRLSLDQQYKEEIEEGKEDTFEKRKNEEGLFSRIREAVRILRGRN